MFWKKEERKTKRRGKKRIKQGVLEKKKLPFLAKIHPIIVGAALKRYRKRKIEENYTLWLQLDNLS